MMDKVLFHIYLPLMLEKKGFVRNFQDCPLSSRCPDSHEGSSEQVWMYLLEIKGTQLRPEQIGFMAAEERGGSEGERIAQEHGLSPSSTNCWSRELVHDRQVRKSRLLSDAAGASNVFQQTGFI